MRSVVPHRKGIVLLNVICFALVFIIIIIPLINWSVNEFSWTTRSFMVLRALNLADAGADLAIWEVVHNGASFTGWSGTNPKTLILSSFTDNLGEVVGDISVSAENTEPNHYLVTSRGFIPSASNPSVRKTVKVKAFPHALFGNAVFGYSSVTAQGNSYVDSYDSDDGPYSPSSAGSNGDVGTNGTLTFMDNAIVKGDAFVGPDGTAMGDTPAHMTGETYYSASDVEFVPVPTAQDPRSPPDPYYTAYSIGGHDTDQMSGPRVYESIIVDGQSTLTLKSGARLHINTSFTIAGQATVITESNVEIYVAGNGSFAGQGIVNATGIPNNLHIYGLNAGTTLSFTGLSDFYGTVYAPQSTVYMAGNADYYGSAVGKTVTLAGNLKFHYDEALQEDGPCSGYDIAYWQED